MKVDSRSVAFKILYQFEKSNNKIPDIRKTIFSKYPIEKDFKFRSTVLVNEIVRLKGKLDLMIIFVSGKNRNVSEN